MVEKLIAELAEQPAKRELIARAEALCNAVERMQETSNRFHAALGNCDPLGEELKLDEETAQMEYSEAFSAASKAVYYMHKAIQAQAKQPAEPKSLRDMTDEDFMQSQWPNRAFRRVEVTEQPAELQGEPVAWLEFTDHDIIKAISPARRLKWIEADPINQAAAKAYPVAAYARPDPRVARLETALRRLEMAARFVPIEDNTDANPDAVELRAALKDAEAALGEG